MAGCRHTDWVEVSCSSRHIRLSDPGRFDRLVGNLKRATQQFPQIVLCIGKDDKRKLVTQAILDRSPSRVTRPSRAAAPSSVGLSSIFSDKSQFEDEHPVFFADCRLEGTIPEGRQFKCHETKSVHNTWPLKQPNIHDTVLTRLLLPFSNLVCLFAEDLGGVDSVLDKIEIWSAMKRTTDLADFARQALPRVCVITSGTLTPSSQIQDEVWRARTDRLSYSNHFSSVQILRFDTGDRSDFHKNFRFSLANELETSRILKWKHRVQFNAIHLVDFFSQATLHLAADPGGKFSFIAASRTYRPVPPAYTEQVRALLCNRAKHRVAFDVVATLIGSCLLLDAYPNSCHEFRAGDLFEGLYANHIETALESGHAALLLPGEKNLQSSAVEDGRFKILVKFIKLAATARKKDGRKDWALRQHMKTLKELQGRIDPKVFISAEICVSCLTGPPQHVLGCGHALCDLCVRRFANVVPGEESCYLLETCAICEARADLTIHLKPATAGVRMLNIDGGGVRGVVPLEFLTRLQKELGPRARIQDFFDIAFGTSAGGLVVLGMFAKGWDLSQCMESFCEFAHRIFGPAAVHSKGMLGMAHTLAYCLLHDGLYSSAPVISSFQDSLGMTSRIFDQPVGNVSRCKYGVTTTKVSATTAIVFSNYNLTDSDALDRPAKEAVEGSQMPGHSEKLPLTSYRRYARANVDDEPFLWEIARATSAAPPFFGPAAVGNDGMHQDGALKNPNTTDILIAEGSAIWHRTRNDYILSLGTGKGPGKKATSTPPSEGKIRNGAPARLLHWSQAKLLEALDAEDIDERVQKSLDKDDGPRYFRWNPEFGDGLPRLDGIKSIYDMRERVKSYPCDKILTDVKMAMLASSFFFELRRLPKYCRDGTYMCEGTIRIRGDPNLVLELLVTSNTECAEFVRRGEELAEVQIMDGICPQCKLFSQQLQFRVRGHDDCHAICLKLGKGREHRISGFPQNMAWFCEQQGLYDVFSAQHSPRANCPCHETTELAALDSRKRKTSSLPGQPQSAKYLMAKEIKARKSEMYASWFF